MSKPSLCLLLTAIWLLGVWCGIGMNSYMESNKFDNRLKGDVWELRWNGDFKMPDDKLNSRVKIGPIDIQAEGLPAF